MMNGVHHRLDSIVVALVTKSHNLFTRLAWILMSYSHIGVGREGAGNMGAGQDSGAIVVFPKVEVQRSCTFKGRVLKGCDREHQCGSRRVAEIRNIVEKVMKSEYLGAWSDRATDY